MFPRRRPLVLVTAVVLVAGLLLVPVMGLLSAVDRPASTRAPVETDPAALEVWRRTVLPVFDDLDTVPHLEGMTPVGRATLNGCVSDESSDLTYGISAGRFWQGRDRYDGEPHPRISEEAVANLDRLVAHLEQRGWQLTDTERQLDPNAPGVEYARRAELERSVAGTSVYAGVQAFLSDSLFVSLTFEDAPPGCRATAGQRGAQ